MECIFQLGAWDLSHLQLKLCFVFLSLLLLRFVQFYVCRQHEFVGFDS